MSLTVSQLLELPCLRRAKVLAGHNSLERIVTSVTVLEYSTPTDMQKKLYESIDFWGSELILTGFATLPMTWMPNVIISECLLWLAK